MPTSGKVLCRRIKSSKIQFSLWQVKMKICRRWGCAIRGSRVSFSCIRCIAYQGRRGREKSFKHLISSLSTRIKVVLIGNVCHILSVLYIMMKKKILTFLIWIVHLFTFIYCHNVDDSQHFCLLMTVLSDSIPISLYYIVWDSFGLRQRDKISYVLR